MPALIWRVNRDELYLGAAECPEQVRSNFTDEGLARRVHVPRTVDSGEERAELLIRQHPFIDSPIIHFDDETQIRAEPSRAGKRPHRTNAGDFLHRGNDL